MRLFTRANKDGLHSHNALSLALEFLNSKDFLATVAIRPQGSTTNPVISSTPTINANWTVVATGLTNILEWRLTELNGNDFQYAYVAAPGDNFQVGFGWVSYLTSPLALYIRRPGDDDVVIKFERWSAV